MRRVAFTLFGEPHVFRGNHEENHHFGAVFLRKTPPELSFPSAWRLGGLQKIDGLLVLVHGGGF